MPRKVYRGWKAFFARLGKYIVVGKLSSRARKVYRGRLGEPEFSKNGSQKYLRTAGKSSKNPIFGNPKFFPIGNFAFSARSFFRDSRFRFSEILLSRNLVSNLISDNFFHGLH